MKRFLSTLMAIFVSFQLLGITSGAEVLTGGSDDGATSIGIIEEGGVFISNVHADTSADGMINFAYEIMNETNHVVSAKAIVAFYNENGSMINCNSQIIRLSAYTSKAFLLSEEVLAYTAKIFLVDNNYIPLCTPEEFVIGNWSEDSGVRMEWTGTGFFDHPEDGVLLTLDTQRNTLTFATADFYFDNELVLIMLMDRETNNIYFIDQVTAHEGTLSLGEKLPAGEHFLWLFGSDGSSANASFEYYGGGEGGEGEGTEDGSVYIDNATVEFYDDYHRIYYDIVNNTSSDICAQSIVCWYNNGALINRYFVNEQIPSKTVLNYGVMDYSTADIAKIFLVDENYIPLCNYIELHIGNYGDSSGVYMSDLAIYDSGFSEILFTFDTENREVSFQTPWSEAESTIVVLTRNDEYMYIDQINDPGAFVGTFGNLPDGEYTLSFYGSDGSVMREYFACYYNGGNEGGEDTDYELEVLDRINNASSIIEIRDILEEYKDIIWVNDEYYSLDSKGQQFVCGNLKGRYFGSMEEIRIAIDVAIMEYEKSQIVSPPSSGGSGGGSSSIEGDNVVSVATVKGNAGETVCVDVMLDNNTGITSMGIEVDYDDSIMTLTDIQTYDATGATVTTAIDLGVKPYHILFDSTNNFTYNGVVATLTFEIAADAPTGEYPITVDYYKGPNGDYIDGEDINFDENFAPVTLTYASGALKIYMPGDLNDDKKVNNKDATYMLRYLADWDIPDIVAVALDVNGDDCIDENDATHLLRYIAKWNGIVLY